MRKFVFNKNLDLYNDDTDKEVVKALMIADIIAFTILTIFAVCIFFVGG